LAEEQPQLSAADVSDLVSSQDDPSDSLLTREQAMKMSDVRKALVKMGNGELVKLFDEDVKTVLAMTEVRAKLRLCKFCHLPQVQTETQAKHGTHVWKTKRGHYTVNKAQNKAGWYARFWPYIRGYHEKLSPFGGDRSVLGRFATEDQAIERCAEHIERNGSKPLQRGMWATRFRMRRK
jgi:hypothetical protein